MLFFSLQAGVVLSCELYAILLFTTSLAFRILSSSVSRQIGSLFPPRCSTNLVESKVEEGLGQKKLKREMGLFSNKIDKGQLKPGDHIYSWRNAYIYAHHGIYIGDGKVIHFTRGGGQEVGTGTVMDRFLFSSSTSPADHPCPICGDQTTISGVIMSCLNCFLGGGDLYVFQYGVTPALFIAKARGGTCTLAVSDPPHDALHRANYLLQNGFGGYDIFKNNCEDFAIYCKTGLLVVTNISVGRSGQATSFVAAATAIVSSPLRFLTTSFAGLTAVAGTMYCISRLVSDIGVRRDVIKIPVESLVSGSGTKVA